MTQSLASDESSLEMWNLILLTPSKSVNYWIPVFSHAHRVWEALLYNTETSSKHSELSLLMPVISYNNPSYL